MDYDWKAVYEFIITPLSFDPDIVPLSLSYYIYAHVPLSEIKHTVLQIMIDLKSQHTQSLTNG